MLCLYQFLLNHTIIQKKQRCSEIDLIQMMLQIMCHLLPMFRNFTASCSVRFKNDDVKFHQILVNHLLNHLLNHITLVKSTTYHHPPKPCQPFSLGPVLGLAADASGSVGQEAPARKEAPAARDSVSVEGGKRQRYVLDESGRFFRKKNRIFPECVAKGSRFTLWGSGG